ncbi:hypothetical protein FC52_GL001481 [Lactobacillus pasteurii DSM 23907 = CRBIP 24.76]|uniref:Phage transcriptional regulator, Cro/CI family n=1 Tax=Lactobacillus pasteurii DSM 23907 = CRBIP 24.76 TaxID=1423790 RepID=I7JXC8_9LACO|nr:helix-turn-helix transcriptional regulator [Lactobacillus pasteurii]KRK07786.1 hypothetical protein FC52_GL001481 [Lactobacillus pasteurii DSM 23907 = CRBIP 24.76]TDG77490.1 hypothetical protein C5L33_000933 [Lactobacillus pasteurii]CCI84500.1 Phage transcriptional regulator, Cro/CI family [Lactobacillus pasteurii DSM 23907 = CRBIP 24.76]
MIELDRVKELAKKQHLSVREVNDLAGLGVNSIYNWKSKKPGSAALKAVAQVLETTTDYLSGLSDSASAMGSSTISLDEDKPYTYQGYRIPDRYIRIVRELMEDDIQAGRAEKL